MKQYYLKNLHHHDTSTLWKKMDKGKMFLWVNEL